MKKITLLTLLAALFCGCATQRSTMQKYGDQNTAIENAIDDFLTCKYSERHRVFIVHIQTIDVAENTIALAISHNDNHIISITEKDTIGSTRLPTRHLIRGGKLFYWNDPDYGMTEEFAVALSQFNYIDTMSYRDAQARYFDNFVPFNPKEKSVHYYFCKNDLTRYKRVISRIALGYYPPPRLRCGKVGNVSD